MQPPKTLPMSGIGMNSCWSPTHRLSSKQPLCAGHCRSQNPAPCVGRKTLPSVSEMIRTDASHGAGRDGAAVGARVRVDAAVGDRVRSGETQSHSVGMVTGRHVRGIRWQSCAAWSAGLIVLGMRPSLSAEVRVTMFWMPAQASSTVDELRAELAQYSVT